LKASIAEGMITQSVDQVLLLQDYVPPRSGTIIHIERIEEYEEAGLDLLLLQMSPQAEEMDRFAAQVIEPMRARAPELT